MRQKYRQNQDTAQRFISVQHTQRTCYMPRLATENRITEQYNPGLLLWVEWGPVAVRGSLERKQSVGEMGVGNLSRS